MCIMMTMTRLCIRTSRQLNPIRVPRSKLSIGKYTLVVVVIAEEEEEEDVNGTANADE